LFIVADARRRVPGSLFLATSRLSTQRDSIGRHAISPSTLAAWVTHSVHSVARGCSVQSGSSRAAWTFLSLGASVARREL
jgi:hypothetical protein